MTNKPTIEGVQVIPLKKFPDERGTVMHGVKKSALLNPFGEVYFKKFYFGVVNGWHLHKEMFLNYICVEGMMKLVLYDMREDSKTYKQFQEIYFGDDNYVLVHIPPRVANASKCVKAPHSIMCNIASGEHDPEAVEKGLRVNIDPHSGEIPYDWARKDF